MYYTCHKNKKKKAFYIFQKTYLNQKIIEFMELKCFLHPNLNRHTGLSSIKTNFN